MNKKELKEYIDNKINKNILENTILFYGEDKDLFKEDILNIAKKILDLDEKEKINPQRAIVDLKISNSFWDFEKKDVEKKALNKKKNIKLQEIREFFSDIYFKSVNGKKVYILDNANNLNTNSQNAILKIIEEPPKGTYIFLLASQTQSILNTIKSRCTKIYLYDNNVNSINNILDENSNDSNKYMENLNSENLKNIKDIFIDSIKLSPPKFIFKYNKYIDKNNIYEIMDSIEDIYALSFKKEKKISIKYKVILELKKKMVYNLNPNILKSELILGLVK